MPRRKRQSKRVGAALTLPRFLALTLGPHPTRGEPDRVLMAVYAHHRERLLEDQPRPWAWWAWEPDIPEELREGRPVLVPVEADAPAGEAEAIRREREALEARRSAWLVEQELQDIITGA